MKTATINVFSNILSTNEIYITKSIGQIIEAQDFLFESNASLFGSLKSLTSDSGSSQTTNCGFGFCAEYKPCDPSQIDPTRCIDALTCPENISSIDNQFIGYAEGETALNTFMADNRCYTLVNNSVPISECSAFVNDETECNASTGSNLKFQNAGAYQSFTVKKVAQTGPHVFQSCAGCCHCDDTTTCISATIEWSGNSGICNFIINTPPTPTTTPTVP